MAHLSQKFLGLVEDMDTLLACHDGFLLGPWLESAKKLAQDEEQEKQVWILVELSSNKTHVIKKDNFKNWFDIKCSLNGMLELR